MAHERLSPRQKMIGMMYLVLTAMLALNVSKEAVKAFMKVEEGLSKTVKNYDAKNKEIYDMFEQKAAENPVRGGPARDRAFNVKTRADELFNYIQGLKIEIIKTAEGPKSKALHGNDIDIYAVEKFDDSNVPSQIMIGAKENGKGFDLRAAINDYRDSLIKIINGRNKTIEDALRASLNTADGKKEGNTGTPEAWPNNTFQTMPLVAVIAMLTKIQVDVRNAETDVITFLYNEIDKRSFKFNRLVPTVLTNSTYVMDGLDYDARVFFAAVDTTQVPTVTVGTYEMTGQNPDGTPKYVMKGDFQTLQPDETGKGVYKIRAGGTPGPRNWGGLISMNAPDGTVISKPFKATYEVGVQNVVISPTAMNVLYRGIKNPIDISVPGVGQGKTHPSMVNGTISEGQMKNSKGEIFPGSYLAEPSSDKPTPTAQIVVSAEINGKQQTFPPRVFRVRDIPDPVGEFAGKSGQGSVGKEELLAQQGVRAVLKDFDFDLQFTVTSFRLSYEDRGLFISKDSNSQYLTNEQKTLLNGLTRGKRLYVENIKAQGPDKKDRPIGPITITVN
jgi:gliding motility-associated protein GldM